MEDNKIIKMKVVEEKEEKESLWSRIKKADKKAIAKRSLIIVGTVAGIVAGYKIMKRYGDVIDEAIDITDQKELSDSSIDEPIDAVDSYESSEE